MTEAIPALQIFPYSKGKVLIHSFKTGDRVEVSIKAPPADIDIRVNNLQVFPPTFDTPNLVNEDDLRNLIALARTAARKGAEAVRTSAADDWLEAEKAEQELEKHLEVLIVKVS